MPPVRAASRRGHTAAGRPNAKSDLASSGGVAEENVLKSTQFALLGLSFDALHPEGRLATGPLLLERCAGGGSSALLPWPPLDRQRLQFDRGVSDWLRQDMLNVFMNEWSHGVDPLCGSCLQPHGASRDQAPFGSGAAPIGNRQGHPTPGPTGTKFSSDLQQTSETAECRLIPLELMNSTDEKEAWLRRHQKVLENLGWPTRRSQQALWSRSRHHSRNIPVACAEHRDHRQRSSETESWRLEHCRDTRDALHLSRDSLHSRAANSFDPTLEDDDGSIPTEGASTDGDDDESEISESASDWALNTIDDDEEYDADVAFATDAEKEAVF